MLARDPLVFHQTRVGAHGLPRPPSHIHSTQVMKLSTTFEACSDARLFPRVGLAYPIPIPPVLHFASWFSS